MSTKNTKRPRNTPTWHTNGHKIHQMFDPKAFKKIPKILIFGMKLHIQSGNPGQLLGAAAMYFQK
jgi:hypothetical protein